MKKKNKMLLSDKQEEKEDSIKRCYHDVGKGRTVLC